MNLDVDSIMERYEGMSIAYLFVLGLLIDRETTNRWFEMGRDEMIKHRIRK